MEQLKQKKKKYNDLDENLKSESRKKKFFSFKNERIEKMEFFNRYCPEYNVVQTLKDEEEENELASNFKLSTREFFAGVVDGENGLTECRDINVAFQKNPVQKKRNHSGLSASEAELSFWKLEDIFARGQHDQYDLPLGDLSFVSNISSENLDSKYHVFANSCANVFKQVQRGSGEILNKVMTAEVPTHPIYGAMIFGSIISLQQVLEALIKAEEFPQLDQLEQLFVDILKFWFNRVLQWRPSGDGPDKLFLRRGAAKGTVLGGASEASDTSAALLGQTLLGQGVGSSHSLLLSVPLTMQADGGGEAV